MIASGRVYCNRRRLPARYENGEWVGVEFLPGRHDVGLLFITFEQIIPGEYTSTPVRPFEFWYGELPPGRYLFIREGRLGFPDERGLIYLEATFALAEFEIK